MFDAYMQAGALLAQPINLLLVVGGVVVGLVIGITPGIGALVGMTLFLPFLFHVPKEPGLIFLIAFSAVTVTGGSITAILLNMPGTVPSMATLLDGFPMNQRGEGSRAIGAAITSSTIGGFVPVFLALGMIPLIIPIVMAFRSPEMAILVLVGVSFIAVLTVGSVTKGLISGALGFVISLIGFQGMTDVDRFTFGILFLYDGLNTVEVALGLFGLAELLNMSITGQATIATQKVAMKLSDVFQGIKDVWRHRWLWLRSTLIGYIVGLIPAAGAETAIFVAYGQAKTISKNPEKFGTGCVEGVIAPESANNASNAGALLTTLAFGVPGSVIMAIFMASLLVVGIVPGPRMLIDHLPLALTLLIGIALASVISGVICIFTAPYLVRVASVKFTFLFPLVLVLIFAGSFVARNYVASIIAVIIFGFLGLLMSRYNFSRPGLLLGFVLGELLEDYTLLSLNIYGPLFFMTPICLVLLAILIGFFSYPYLKKSFTYWFKERLKKA